MTELGLDPRFEFVGSSHFSNPPSLSLTVCLLIHYFHLRAPGMHLGGQKEGLCTESRGLEHYRWSSSNSDTNEKDE